MEIFNECTILSVFYLLTPLVTHEYDMDIDVKQRLGYFIISIIMINMLVNIVNFLVNTIYQLFHKLKPLYLKIQKLCRTPSNNKKKKKLKKQHKDFLSKTLKLDDTQTNLKNES